jgi:predicted homoserine dehydrogenase-like protein
MLNIPSQLREREEPIRVGVIGAGLFGTKLVDQIKRAPGMRTAVIADIDADQAMGAYREAAVDVDEVAEVDDVTGIDTTIREGGRAYVPD